jgi:hypothetical protein
VPPLLTFLRTPTRQRAAVVVGVEFGLVFAALWLLGNAWAQLMLFLMCTTAVLLLHVRDGVVLNLVSVMARRPVALTRRGRSLIDVRHVAPQTRKNYGAFALMYGFFMLILIL